MAPLDLKFQPDSADFDDGRVFVTIKDLLEHGSKHSIEESATTITSLLPGPPASEGSDEVWSLWNLFIAVAKQIPFNAVAMLKLVRLLDVLSKSPNTTAVVTSPSGYKTASRLHGLGWNLRDMLSLTPYQDKESSTPEAAAGWLNLNGFMALLFTYNLVDSRHFALWQLRDAFETEAQSPEDFESRVRVAAVWILRAGQVIVNLVDEQGDLAPEDERSMKAGPLFADGQWGFNSSRWDWWKQELKKAVEKFEDGDTKKLVANAAAFMDALEGTRPV